MQRPTDVHPGVQEYVARDPGMAWALERAVVELGHIEGQGAFGQPTGRWVFYVSIPLGCRLVSPEEAVRLGRRRPSGGDWLAEVVVGGRVVPVRFSESTWQKPDELHVATTVGTYFYVVAPPGLSAAEGEVYRELRGPDHQLGIDDAASAAAGVLAAHPSPR